jgi:LysW-gamma-L-lysine carboxypeptidase
MSDVRAGQGAAFDGDGEARELLADLVAIPSVSGEEAECVERLRSFFEAHDREVWVDDAGNLRAPADDAALLTSHVDTVPGSIPVRTEEPDPGTAGRATARTPTAPSCTAAGASTRRGRSPRWPSPRSGPASPSPASSARRPTPGGPGASSPTARSRRR